MAVSVVAVFLGKGMEECVDARVWLVASGLHGEQLKWQNDRAAARRL